ncbi:MAG: hypothetical protein JWM26_1907 [Betaproteobacteria bacterium]|nr:hypothetical protein [Betaproteobacteria bacterium]
MVGGLMKPIVIPAKAGIHFDFKSSTMDSGSLPLARVRNDGLPTSRWRGSE